MTIPSLQFVASDPKNGLPVFPMLERASRHDMLSFLHTFSAMKSYLPEFHIEKLLLDFTHDAYPLYEYCKTNRIAPFIDPNPGHTGHFKYKDNFTIGEDGVPVCKLGLRMHHDGVEKAKHHEKYRCPLPTGKKDVSVNIPAPVPDTAEPYIYSKRTTPGFLTYRQRTVMNGNWNTTNGPLLNGQINVKR